MLHGIGGWFTAQLSKNVSMSNSPLVAEPIGRMNVFFPIDHPVAVSEGDRVNVSIHIMPVDIIVTWKVEVFDSSSNGAPTSKGNFSHSTWKGMLIAKEYLLRTDPTFVPKLTTRGEARRTVLNLCEDNRTLAEIEQEVYQRHRALFNSFDEASVFVAEVITRYSVR